jgi:hypothetical protein
MQIHTYSRRPAKQAFEVYYQTAYNPHRKANRADDGGDDEEDRFLEFYVKEVHSQRGNGIMQENTDD